MQVVSVAKNELNRAVDRLKMLLEVTPEDRLHFKPSESARSIAEVVSHVTNALENILSQLKGTPFPLKNSAIADPIFREHDSVMRSRETLVHELEVAVQEYESFLDSLKESDLDAIRTLPFGLGSVPLRFFIGAGAAHTQGHVAQIEYIQTIYGDHHWHSGF